MRFILTLLVLLVGCTPLPGPNVSLEFNWDVEDEDQSWITGGALVWEELGFNIAGDDPEIVIWVEIEELGGNIAGRAFRGVNVILLDSDLSGKRLLTASAHEFGHILLDTGEHSEEPGIMYKHLTDFSSLQESDFEFACRVANKCERF